MAAFAILAVVIRTSSHAQLAPTSSSWPMFHHDLDHTGLSPFNTSTNVGALRWKFTTGNHVESSPAIGSDGTVYFGSDDGNVYAVDASGNQKWQFTTLGSSIVRSSPAISADGTIYVGSEGSRTYGGIYALNPDGTQKWYYRTGFDVDSSPAIGSDGTIYVGSAGWVLYALTPTGTLKWKFVMGSYVVSSPAISADGTIYIGSIDGNVYAVGAQSTATPTPTSTGTATPTTTETATATATATATGTATPTATVTVTPTVTATAIATATDAATAAATATETATATATPTPTSPPTPTPTPTPSTLVTLLPPTLDFGTVTLGQTSAASIVTLSNGTGTLTIRGWSIGIDFTVVSTTCPSVLNSGQSCTYMVAFRPQSVGTRNELFRVFGSAPNNTQKVQLLGVGTYPTNME